MLGLDIATYLSSQGIGTLAADVFYSFLPPTPDAAVVVYETGGMAPAHAMRASAGGTVVERPSVQVVCRGGVDDFDTARSKADAVFRLLDQLPDRSINGTRYLYGSARQSPFLLDRDEVGRVLVACNFDIVKELG